MEEETNCHTFKKKKKEILSMLKMSACFHDTYNDSFKVVKRLMDGIIIIESIIYS